MISIFITFEIRYKHILKIIFWGGVYKLIHTLTFISCYNSFTTIFNYCIYFFMYVCACIQKKYALVLYISSLWTILDMISKTSYPYMWDASKRIHS